MLVRLVMILQTVFGHELGHAVVASPVDRKVWRYLKNPFRSLGWDWTRFKYAFWYGMELSQAGVHTKRSQNKFFVRLRNGAGPLANVGTFILGGYLAYYAPHFGVHGFVEWSLEIVGFSLALFSLYTFFFHNTSDWLSVWTGIDPDDGVLRMGPPASASSDATVTAGEWLFIDWLYDGSREFLGGLRAMRWCRGWWSR